MVNKYQTDISDTSGTANRRRIPIAGSYKGKVSYTYTSGKLAMGKKIILAVVGSLFAIDVLAMLVLFVIKLPGMLKIYLLIAAFLLGGIMAGLIFLFSFRHNKGSTSETHYYDVDMKYNNISREYHDNTREISREDFYRKNKIEEEHK